MGTMDQPSKRYRAAPVTAGADAGKALGELRLAVREVQGARAAHAFLRTPAVQRGRSLVSSMPANAESLQSQWRLRAGGRNA